MAVWHQSGGGLHISTAHMYVHKSDHFDGITHHTNNKQKKFKVQPKKHKQPPKTFTHYHDSHAYL